MKILLANKFYYRRGGDCVYALNLEELLKAHGHEVAVFSMQYPENLDSEWKNYWPSQMTVIKAFVRPLGTREVKDKFTKLLNDFKPEVVHLNNIHSQLSPVIGELAHNYGAKVVWTLHDYKLLCPRYDCLQNGRQICEECYTDKRGVLKHSCMKNSFIASIVAYYEAKRWNRTRLENATDVYICPSQFMANKMAQGGFSKEKLQPLCNFINITKCQGDVNNHSDYYCYVGRLSAEKGTKTLIEAANQLPYHLVIIGKGPLEKELKPKAGKNVEFVGFKQWDEIKELVGKAKFSVIPSECYENNPLSVIESQCLGTPVLGARIGGIPELIEENVSGATFKSGDVKDLKDKILSMWNASFDYESIAEKATKRYSSETYYEQLMKIYK